MTPDVDDSARLVTELIHNQQPFSFWRFGDGALNCVRGLQGATCDGEWYNPELGAALDNAMHATRSQYQGDWETAVNGSAPQSVAEWKRWMQPTEDKLLHFEALLLNRQSSALLAFYRAVKADKRRKLIVGAHFNRGAGELLNAEYLAVPLQDLWDCINVVAARIAERRYDVLLFGAGLAIVPTIAAEWVAHQERTYIHLGSAFDPYTKGRTRSGQLTSYQARTFLAELL